MENNKEVWERNYLNSTCKWPVEHSYVHYNRHIYVSFKNQPSG